ncbi:MAG TPA: hypothetical protein VH914_09085 [Acidimicrobiia bacterium]|nr:hypothetical protein [Acidimicrobiia bacterium]
MLHLEHVSTITPAADKGANAVDTDWQPTQHAQMSAFASSEGATLPEFEKTGALFVAFVLALSH